MKRRVHASLILSGFLAMAALPAAAADNQVVNGQCNAQSHTAEGAIGADLTKRQSRFFCDAAVITFFDNSGSHVMIQFSQKAAHHTPILGFGGMMESDGQILDVDHFYIDTGQPPVTPDDSGCKFFFTAKRMTSIYCFAKIDEDGRRTVASVSFIASGP